MNRTRLLNTAVPFKRVQKNINFGACSELPKGEFSDILKIIYGDGKGDISLYLNQNTPPEIRVALEKLMRPLPAGDKYPDDVVAFDMLRKENESRSAYAQRLQQIINDAYQADISAAQND